MIKDLNQKELITFSLNVTAHALQGLAAIIDRGGAPAELLESGGYKKGDTITVAGKRKRRGPYKVKKTVSAGKRIVHHSKHSLEPWSKNDEKFLLTNADKMSRKAIAKKLGRTVSAVSGRLSYLRKKAKKASIKLAVANGNKG